MSSSAGKLDKPYLHSVQPSPRVSAHTGSPKLARISFVTITGITLRRSSAVLCISGWRRAVESFAASFFPPQPQRKIKKSQPTNHLELEGAMSFAFMNPKTIILRIRASKLESSINWRWWYVRPHLVMARSNWPPTEKDKVTLSSRGCYLTEPEVVRL